MCGFAGFIEVTVTTGSDSYIAGFATYGLDLKANEQVRKLDRLFVEARKPI